jgi:hypothetical protein
LGDLCAWLAPALEVGLDVKEDGEPRAVIAGGDWRYMPAEDLLRRLYGQLSPRNQDEIVAAAARDMRSILSPEGRVLARLTLARPSVPPNNRRGINAPLIVGGLRAGTALSSVIGVASATSTRAARDMAVPSFRLEVLREWASEQAQILRGRYPGEDEAELAERVLAFGGNAEGLAIAESETGWLTLEEVSAFALHRDEVLLLQDDVLSLKRLHNPDESVALDESVLALNVGRRGLLTQELSGTNASWRLTDPFGWEGWSYRFYTSRTVEGAVAMRIAEAWGFDGEVGLKELENLSEIKRAWESDEEDWDREDDPNAPLRRQVGTTAGVLWNATVDVLDRDKLRSQASSE